MKKFLCTLSCLVVAIALFMTACSKSSEDRSIETIERNDPKTEFGNFTPTVFRYSENNTRVDINFVETPLVFTLNLKEKGSHHYLEIIKSSIKSLTPVLINVYEGGMIGSKIEIATVEKSSASVIEKFKKEAVSP